MYTRTQLGLTWAPPRRRPCEVISAIVCDYRKPRSYNNIIRDANDSHGVCARMCECVYAIFPIRFFFLYSRRVCGSNGIDSNNNNNNNHYDYPNIDRPGVGRKRNVNIHV